jgi:hypothetical protein
LEREGVGMVSVCLGTFETPLGKQELSDTGVMSITLGYGG